MQEDQALGHIQCHSATLPVPAEGADAVGIAVLQYTRLQVPALHVLHYQHGAGGVQTRAIQLHHVTIIRQLVHQMDLLHEAQAIHGVIGWSQIWREMKLAFAARLRLMLPEAQLCI